MQEAQEAWTLTHLALAHFVIGVSAQNRRTHAFFNGEPNVLVRNPVKMRRWTWAVRPHRDQLVQKHKAIDVSDTTGDKFEQRRIVIHGFVDW